MSAEAPAEFFPALSAVSGVVHAFTGRVPGVDVAVDRELALARLDASHYQTRDSLGLGGRTLITARQVHSAAVATVHAGSKSPVEDVDGLITDDPSVCLGIYVADCGPVFLVEPESRVIALLHSGRKGTEGRITAVAIQQMVHEFGCDPSRIVVQLGPCIRPPLYEINFAADIIGQARGAGVTEVYDCGVCTGANVDRYYSYRVEKGKTGRMVAFLALSA